MSSSNAPPNPGTPKTQPMAPRPSVLARHGGKVATGAAVAAVGLFYLLNPASPRSEPVVNFRTPGVKNIEEAYSNAGATATHTKAYGGTVQGKKDEVDLREGGGTGTAKHSQTPFGKEGMGDDQRPWPTSKLGEAFDHTQYGSSKGK